MGQLEIVIRAHDDLAPQGFLVHRVNHHELNSYNLNRQYYRFFDSTIKNIHRADTSGIKLKNLTPLLDYRIQSGISYLVRTDYLLIELIIPPYLKMVKQWEGIKE
ncbi:hypothetical protein [Borreliella garinii]|uniref:Uncharacterized protein n=1 Tax=Borreliella garinii PBr TaxID=498743 RepID=B8F108_BORGR|nr:hypothetical protein [Borreliella garinii]ACL34622.1 conserved hypothetical protein [Borreliella garinii PBr]